MLLFRLVRLATNIATNILKLASSLGAYLQSCNRQVTSLAEGLKCHIFLHAVHCFWLCAVPVFGTLKIGANKTRLPDLLGQAPFQVAVHFQQAQAADVIFSDHLAK